MDIIDLIREQEADIAFLLGEEFGDMVNSFVHFVKIGKRSVNLDTVTTIKYSPDGGYSHRSPCVTISFIGDTDNYISIYKEDEPEAFSQLMTWMDEQPTLLTD